MSMDCPDRMVLTISAWLAAALRSHRSLGGVHLLGQAQRGVDVGKEPRRTQLVARFSSSTEAAAKERFVEFTAKWGAQYPAIIRLWENAWTEFVPFLDTG